MANYVVAGGTTISNGFKTLVEMQIANVENIKMFLDKTTKYFLTSIGECLSRKEEFKKEKFIKRVVKLYDKTYNNDWFRDTYKVVDSGGYQISIGYIKEDQLEEFIDAYTQLLNHPQIGGSCKYMLSLDIVADYPIISSKEKMEYLNRKSLEETIKYDTSKVFLIYHFINPRLEQFWWNIVKDYFDYFNHFSIGGLVAFSRNSDFPFNVYILPLLKIINEKISRNQYSPFTFHILGVSSFIDIFSFVVFEKFLKEIYDIDVTINFDSTRAIRETVIAKKFHVYFDNKFVPLCYKSDLLHMKSRLNKTYSETLSLVLREFCDAFNFNLEIPDKLEAADIYKDNGKGAIKREYEILFTMCAIKGLQDTVNFFDYEAQQVVDAVLKGDIVKAERIITETLIQINAGKKSKNLVIKARALLNSLDIIKHKPSTNQINEFMQRVLEGVQPFTIFDKQTTTNIKSLENLF